MFHGAQTELFVAEPSQQRSCPVLWSDVKERKRGQRQKRSFSVAEFPLQQGADSCDQQTELLYLSASRLSLYLNTDLMNQQTDTGWATRLWPANSSPWPGSRRNRFNPELTLSQNTVPQRSLFGPSPGTLDKEKDNFCLLKRECLAGIQSEVSLALEQYKRLS